jgi:hypothetical protein
MRTIEDWGKTQKGPDLRELTEITVEALLKTVTLIAVYRQMAAAGLPPQKAQEYLRGLNREAPVSADADDPLLAWQARKEVLLRDLQRSIRGYSA